MCGIVLLYGPNSRRRLPLCLEKIKHRGPDDVADYHKGQLSLGFVRLAINGQGEQGKQPVVYRHIISAVNGEIFNKSVLENQFKLPSWSDNDCHVVASLFEKVADSLVDHLDGFYAGLIYDDKQNRLYSLRDYLGKKPLFVGRSGTELFIVSELKSISSIDKFSALPLGCCEVNLDSGEITELAQHQNSLSAVNSDSTLNEDINYAELTSILTQAVEKRLPAMGDPVGVFLSGGLDSSVVTSIVAKYRPDVTYYVLADEASSDFQYAKQLIENLGLKQVQYVALPKSYELQKLIEAVVYATQSYNPSIISNGLCSYLLARAAKKDGLKIVLSGEGADELFFGYHCFTSEDDWRGTRQRLLLDMQFTELRRVDLACMAHAIECRCPYLDIDVYRYAHSLTFKDFYRSREGRVVNKYALRQAFSLSLPDEVCWRDKISSDVGSGIRDIVVTALTSTGLSEKEALKSIWNGYFEKSFRHSGLCDNSYFHSYPVFDQAIAKRGVVHR